MIADDGLAAALHLMRNATGPLTIKKYDGKIKALKKFCKANFKECLVGDSLIVEQDPPV